MWLGNNKEESKEYEDPLLIAMGENCLLYNVNPFDWIRYSK